MRSIIPAFALAVLFAGPALSTVDCALCSTVCKDGKTSPSAYPDDPQPDTTEQGVRHNDPDAERAFDDAQRHDPAFGGRDIKAAIASYKRAATLDGKNAQYRNYLAAALMRAGIVKEAIYNLTQAVEIVPASSKYRVNLGYAYHRANNEPRALLHYMRGLMLDPADLRARLFVGYALERLGMADEAALEFRRVLLQDAKNEGARRGLARVEKRAR